MKTKLAVFACLSILFILAESGFSQTQPKEDPPVKAEINKTNITLDETIAYKLTIACFKGGVPELEPPVFGGFIILSKSQSSSSSFSKEGVACSIVCVYVLAPKEKGKIKIAPAKIKINGKTYSSQSFEIEVGQGKTKLPVPPGQEPQITL